MRLLSSWTAALALVLVSVAAQGQQAPVAVPGSPVSTQGAPDIVALKDGSILRGTIAEMKPGGSVTIVLITGQTRTIAMAEVEYAGPAAERPAKAPSLQPLPSPNQAGSNGPRPLVTVSAGEAPISFTSEPSGITLHLQSGTSTGMVSTSRGAGFVIARSYTPVCTAPCQASLATGTYTLALSQGKGHPVEADVQVRVDGPSRVEGKYESYSGMRYGGVGVLIGGLVVGSYLMLTASEKKQDCSYSSCSDTRSLNSDKLYAGAGVMIGSALVGWILMSKSDEAHITVSPVSAAALGARPSVSGNPSSTVLREAAIPTGLAMTGAF